MIFNNFKLKFQIEFAKQSKLIYENCQINNRFSNEESLSSSIQPTLNGSGVNAKLVNISQTKKKFLDHLETLSHQVNYR